MTETTPPRHYPVIGPSEAAQPDYTRVVRALPDAELEDEILGGRGEEDYRLALVMEYERRAETGPPA